MLVFKVEFSHLYSALESGLLASFLPAFAPFAFSSAAFASFAAFSDTNVGME